MNLKESNGLRDGAPPVDPVVIREQLERVLSSHSFRNSKRHSAFLRYVVEESLCGTAPQIKERSIGVQVFGLDPAYDTSSNPVVRVSAGELRKRLAQYYHSPEHSGELRIELPPGSYAPEFCPHRTLEAVAAPLAVVSENSFTPPRRRYAVYAVAATAIVLLAGAVFAVKALSGRDAFTEFWQPLWDSPGTAIISVAARPVKDESGRVMPERMALNDAVAMARLTPVLQSHGKDFRVLNRETTTLADLKRGPAVFIGAFSNELAMRLMREARFNFEMDQEAGLSWIRDRQNPSSKQWRLNRPPNDPAADFTDYAIVSRVLDPTTDRIAVVAAGITARGTRASAEFVATPSAMAAISASTAKGWGRNVQVVLAIPISAGGTGTPKVLAAYSW